MTEPVDLLQHLAAIGLGHLTAWHRAVTLQADRVLQKDASAIDAQTDGYTFVLALRQLLRAAHLVRDSVDDPRSGTASRVVAAFESAVPDAKRARDVLDHFDDYARGLGDLAHPGVARRNRVPSSEAAGQFTIYYERGAERFVLHVGELGIDVGGARAAADALFDGLMNLYYEPVNDDGEVVDMIVALGPGNPVIAALTFLLTVTAEDFSEALLELRQAVTPESIGDWGDFREANRALQDYSLGTYPTYASENVAYVKVLHGPTDVAIVREPLIVVDAMFVTLQRRADCGDRWLVHRIGPKAAPDELP